MGKVITAFTPIDAVTATTESGAIPVKGARKITIFGIRAAHSSGSSAFSVTVSGDGTNFVAYNRLLTNVANNNSQTPVRAASFALAANGTDFASMDLSTESFDSIKVKVTETTDGTHSVRVIIEYDE